MFSLILSMLLRNMQFYSISFFPYRRSAPRRSALEFSFVWKRGNWCQNQNTSAIYVDIWQGTEKICYLFGCFIFFICFKTLYGVYSSLVHFPRFSYFHERFIIVLNMRVKKISVQLSAGQK